MIFEKIKPAYPYISNVKFMTSVKNAENKNKYSLFNIKK